MLVVIVTGNPGVTARDPYPTRRNPYPHWRVRVSAGRGRGLVGFFFITTGWGSAAGSQCVMTLPFWQPSHCQQLLYY